MLNKINDTFMENWMEGLNPNNIGSQLEEMSVFSMNVPEGEPEAGGHIDSPEAQEVEPKEMDNYK